jgi:hypothetical protein
MEAVGSSETMIYSQNTIFFWKTSIFKNSLLEKL